MLKELASAGIDRCTHASILTGCFIILFAFKCYPDVKYPSLLVLCTLMTYNFCSSFTRIMKALKHPLRFHYTGVCYLRNYAKMFKNTVHDVVKYPWNMNNRSCIPYRSPNASMPLFYFYRASSSQLVFLRGPLLINKWKYVNEY